MASRDVFSVDELDRLRRYPEPTRADLIRYFTLSPADVEFVVGHRGMVNRLGVAVQLCTLWWLGFVPDRVADAPVEAVARVAEVLGCDPSILAGYGEREQTRTDHLARAVSYAGWTNATVGEWKGLDEFLFARALEHDSPRLLFTAGCEYLRAVRVVRPGVVNVLERVATARERAQGETWHRMSSVLTPDWLSVLDGLLTVDDTVGGSRLEWLERAPIVASPASVRIEVAKLGFLREIGADRLDLSMVPVERRRFLARVARRSSTQALARRDGQRRYPLLASLVSQGVSDVLDEIVGLFDQLLSGRESHASVKSVVALADRARSGEDRQALLDELLVLILDPEISDVDLGGRLRRGIGMERLELAWQQRPGRLPRDHGRLAALEDSIGHVRKFAPRVLTAIELDGGVAAQELLLAVAILTGLYRSGARHVPDGAPAGFVPPRWQEYLDRATQTDDRTAYRHYWELCVLLALRDGLRSGDVFVPGSRRYSDPTAFLLKPARWEAMRSEFCALVGKPADPADALSELDHELHVALADLDEVLASGTGPGEVRIDDHGDLVVPRMAAAAVPDEVAGLRVELTRMLPHVTLASILVELDSRLGLFRHLDHAGGVTNRPADLHRNLIYVVLAQATNMGLTAMARACGVTYETLAWTAEWYLREDTLRTANTALINYHHKLPGAAAFGPGTLSSSDGQRFPTRGHSLTARHLSRYFARGQGISSYTHVSDQHTTFATRVIPATASESHYVLGNDTDLPNAEHSTDTHGATLANFALFDLVGLRLSPRIRDLGKVTLCRTGPKAAFTSRYPHAGQLLTRRADLTLITRQWDDMLRVAASVKHGQATAAIVVGKLCSTARQQNDLTAAIKEYGALRRTIYAARYLADDNYRHRTLRQLNKGENLHDLRRTIAFAGQGALRGHDHTDHTEQMWTLTLITNAAVVWTSEYYARAARQLEQAGHTIDPAHLSHIWPSHHDNINLYGVHTVDIADELAQLDPDGYRPLRRPPRAPT